jgi:hypothetical protein
LWGGVNPHLTLNKGVIMPKKKQVKSPPWPESRMDQITRKAKEKKRLAAGAKGKYSKKRMLAGAQAVKKKKKK